MSQGKFPIWKDKEDKWNIRTKTKLGKKAATMHSTTLKLLTVEKHWHRLNWSTYFQNKNYIAACFNFRKNKAGSYVLQLALTYSTGGMKNMYAAEEIEKYDFFLPWHLQRKDTDITSILDKIGLKRLLSVRWDCEALV